MNSQLLSPSLEYSGQNHDWEKSKAAHAASRAKYSASIVDVLWISLKRRTVRSRPNSHPNILTHFKHLGVLTGSEWCRVLCPAPTVLADPCRIDNDYQNKLNRRWNGRSVGGVVVVAGVHSNRSCPFQLFRGTTKHINDKEHLYNHYLGKSLWRLNVVTTALLPGRKTGPHLTQCGQQL